VARFADTQKYVVSEDAVDRLLKAPTSLAARPSSSSRRQMAPRTRPHRSLSVVSKARLPHDQIDWSSVMLEACFQHDGWFYFSTILDDATKHRSAMMTAGFLHNRAGRLGP
jgi:hypothetical protein